MRKNGRYLERQTHGFRFQMAVPEDVRPLVRRRMWRQYLGPIPEPEARLAALHLAIKCQTEIDRLRRILTAGAESEFALPTGSRPGFGGNQGMALSPA